MSDGDEHDPSVDLVRPYLMTGGRTRSRGPDLQVETLVATTTAGKAAGEDQAFESRQVLTRCIRPLSIAEVASAIDVPIGVARVVVGDLVADGLLDVKGETTKDEDLVRRLIDGVRSL